MTPCARCVACAQPARITRSRFYSWDDSASARSGPVTTAFTAGRDRQQWLRVGGGGAGASDILLSRTVVAGQRLVRAAVCSGRVRRYRHRRSGAAIALLKFFRMTLLTSTDSRQQRGLCRCCAGWIAFRRQDWPDKPRIRKRGRVIIGPDASSAILPGSLAVQNAVGRCNDKISS